MTPLAGYADRLSVRPGETIRFHVATDRTEPVTASVIRVISADANPAGPGIIEEAAEVPVKVVAAPTAQRVPLGSYGEFPSSPLIADLTSFTVVVTVWVGGLEGSPGCIMALGDLGRSAHRVLLATVGGAGGIRFLASVGLGAAMPAEVESGRVDAERWVSGSEKSR